MIGTLERNYARALLELANEAERSGGAKLGEISAEALQLRVLLEQEPDLLRLISVQTLSVQERGQIIERILKGRINDLLYRFLIVVNEKNRLEYLPGMLAALEKLVEEQRGIVEIDAFVAANMDEPAQRSVAESISKALGKQVIMHQHVDPKLIGGLKLRIGDQLIDGSVAAQLRLMKDRMIHAGQELARKAAV